MLSVSDITQYLNERINALEVDTIFELGFTHL